MLLEALLFIIGLGLLIKGADLFVDGGGGLASRYGVSPVTIGFTVIAFGTSLPEFVVSLNAVASGSPGIALGNVVGSNIANIALVLAICAILRPGLFTWERTEKGGVRHETLLMLIATAIFMILALRGVIDFFSGVAMLAAFGLILHWLWKNGGDNIEKIESHGNMDWAYTVGGLIAVIIGSSLVLDSSVFLAEALNIPSFVIGLSMVAIGTSLPELATSLVAIKKGQTGLSAGNLLGSNIFNLLFVMGAAGLVGSVPVPSYTDVLVMGAFSLAVVPLFYAKERLTAAIATLMIIAYAAYILFLFGVL